MASGIVNNAGDLKNHHEADRPPFDHHCQAAMVEGDNAYYSACVERSTFTTTPFDCRKCEVMIKLKFVPEEKPPEKVCGDPVEGSKKFCATCKVLRDKYNVKRSHVRAKKKRTAERIKRDQAKLEAL